MAARSAMEPSDALVFFGATGDLAYEKSSRRAGLDT